MTEAELLHHIERLASAKPLAPGVLVGPGDDCAVLTVSGNILITVDQLVAGRHYDPSRTPLDLIARKAIARSVSDIAAMAGTPIASVVAGCCPSGFPDAAHLIDATHRWGRALGCPVIGGDLASHDGGLILTVTVLGTCHPTRGPVLRSGAAAGDSVWVTGPLGASFRTDRHLSFEPRIRAGIALATLLGPRLTSMIDISDGLGRDAGRIARASGVRLELDAALFPLAFGAHDWQDAARDGEDYELVFTGTHADRDTDALLQLGCTRIGRVAEGSGCVIRSPSNETIDAHSMGWDHR